MPEHKHEDNVAVSHKSRKHHKKMLKGLNALFA